MIIEGRDLRVPALTFLTMKITSRKDILEYVKSVDSDYRTEGNVVYARKAFLTNTVIQWCYDQIKTEQMHPSEMEFYLMAIQGFIEGKTNLSWDEEGNLVIS